MRDRMERLVILPLSFGCVSEGTIAAGIPHPRRSRPNAKSPAVAIKGPRSDKNTSESLSGENKRFHEDVPRSNTSPNLNRLLKGFKNFPQLFVDKEEELEVEMEIGCPTNVQHVTHIGWDGIEGAATATSMDSIRG